MYTLHPASGRDSNRKWPPAISARSRMPTRPTPARVTRAPAPSSWTSTASCPSATRSRIRTAVADAWRTMFVSASRTHRKAVIVTSGGRCVSVGASMVHGGDVVELLCPVGEGPRDAHPFADERRREFLPALGATEAEGLDVAGGAGLEGGGEHGVAGADEPDVQGEVHRVEAAACELVAEALGRGEGLADVRAVRGHREADLDAAAAHHLDPLPVVQRLGQGQHPRLEGEHSEREALEAGEPRAGDGLEDRRAEPQEGVLDEVQRRRRGRRDRRAASRRSRRRGPRGCGARRTRQGRRRRCRASCARARRGGAGGRGARRRRRRRAGRGASRDRAARRCRRGRGRRAWSARRRAGDSAGRRRARASRRARSVGRRGRRGRRRGRAARVGPGARPAARRAGRRSRRRRRAEARRGARGARARLRRCSRGPGARGAWGSQ